MLEKAVSNHVIRVYPIALAQREGGELSLLLNSSLCKLDFTTYMCFTFFDLICKQAKKRGMQL